MTVSNAKKRKTKEETAKKEKNAKKKRHKKMLAKKKEKKISLRQKIGPTRHSTTSAAIIY